MADAPSTSPYILAAPDTNLPNSRVLLASGGLVSQDTGAEGTLTINTVGNLNQLNAFNAPGIVVYNTGSSTFNPVSLNSGSSIAITNPSGQGGNPTFNVVPNSTVQQVNILNNGVQRARRANLNLIPAGSVSISVSDNSLDDRADITISAINSAPDNAKYVLNMADSNLPNAQSLSTLGTGILKVTTGTGIISRAITNVDYQLGSPILTSISEITPTVGSLMVGNGSGYSRLGAGSVAGQVLTSNGSGVDPSYQAPSTRIPGLGLNWFQIGASLGVAMQSNAGYYQSAGIVPYTLPPSAELNDVFVVAGRFPSTGFRIARGAPGQNINYGGATGATLTASAGYNAVMLICCDTSSGVGTEQFSVLNQYGTFVLS